MPQGISRAERNLNELIKRVEKIEQENKLLKKVILSAQPLMCVYKEGFPTWHRHYHTEENFLNRHINKFKFTLDTKDNDIGYLLKINPNNIFKEK